MREAEFVIVGTGASAVHAALPLAEAGRRVVLVDIGQTPETSEPIPVSIPEEDWLSLRTKRKDQHRWFLGENFEGVPLGPVRVGAQLTPARQYHQRGAEVLLPIDPKGFAAMQSVAQGGLGTAWGASSMAYSDEDLRGWPVGRAELQPHYDAVAQEIGISSPTDDDLTPLLGPIRGLQKPFRLDSNAAFLMERYQQRREGFLDRGFALGQARLAMLTESRPEEGRRAVAYEDMEFWNDAGRSIYRPQFTLEKLRAMPNVTYLSGCVAEKFVEQEGVTLHGRELASGEVFTIRGRALILAAGTLNTTRIVLRSLGVYHQPVPLLSNPYTYYPSLNLWRLGKRTRNRRHSLTQLTALYDPDGTRQRFIQPQFYSYRSLLLFKLLKESPLPLQQSLPILRALVDYFVIIGVFHPDFPSAEKSLLLRPAENPGDDWLQINYRRSGAERARQQQDEERLCRLFRELGAYPLKRVLPGDGASIHYAGTLPSSTEERSLTTSPLGRLHGTRGVYCTDGSVFPTLPAKGLTFTLMANARRIANALLQN